MKRLDIVTVLFNGKPESPGIVTGLDFVTEGEQPSLSVAMVLPSGGVHILKACPHVSGIEASYKWTEYSPDHFTGEDPGTATVVEGGGGEAAAAGADGGGGQAATTTA